MLALRIAEIVLFLGLMCVLYKIGFFRLLGRAVKELGSYKKNTEKLKKELNK